MIRAMIVEDEPVHREGLARHVRWAALGYADPVLADAYAAEFMGRKPLDIPYIAEGAARKVGSLAAVTIGSCVVTALVTGSSYLSVILPGELLAPAYKARGLAAKNLSRIIDECGGIIVPLIPWSMAGVYITGALGVPVFSYLPWAMGNWLAIVILAIYGFTRFTMAPKIRDDETQAGS